MIRTILVVALVGAWFAAEATGEVLRVEGEILSASLPWTERLFDERDGPRLGFPSHLAPVPYVGLLTLDTDNSRASFQVSIDSCIAGAELCLAIVDVELGIVDGNSAPTTYGNNSEPTTYRLSANLFAGVVQNDASEVKIDFTSLPRPEEWVTSFSLRLDKATGMGEWRWSNGPMQLCNEDTCAPSVPGNDSHASISGFQVVPEPAGWVLTAWVGLAIAARRREDASSGELGAVKAKARG